MNSKVRHYYNEYHGHRVSDLMEVENSLRILKGGKESTLIFLAGDSSLDNKHWFDDTGIAVNGYDHILDPPISKLDIAHWLNVDILELGMGTSFVAINAAVEESTVGLRSWGRLLPQDEFIRDSIQSNDVLVLSVGGNDIALRPSFCTIANILLLICCTTNSCLEHCTCGTSLPCDDYCAGCSTGCLSNTLAFPLGYGYMIHLFSTRIQHYILNMTSKQRPKKILICMIYYPDETATGSWADVALKGLGYDSNPRKLQTLIRKMFRDATRRIVIPGSEVIAVPLFAALNGKISSDYSQRVEPSAVGGHKMSRLILSGILDGQAAVDRALLAAERGGLGGYSNGNGNGYGATDAGEGTTEEPKHVS